MKIPFKLTDLEKLKKLFGEFEKGKFIKMGAWE